MSWPQGQGPKARRGWAACLLPYKTTLTQNSATMLIGAAWAKASLFIIKMCLL